MGVYTSITKAPWRVEAPLQPIGGESLDGFIARVAAASWIDNALTITNLAGVTYGHKPTLATHGWDGLPILADCLQVDVEELRCRSYPAIEGTDRRQFFGVEVERRDIETRVRRFAPASLALSPHHRAMWQLRPFPFCSETWQYLVDQCPRCGAVQRWYHANGIDRCDQCVEELSLAPAETVPDEERPALRFAIGLVHADPALRQRSLFELPAELQALGPAAAFELLVRLTTLVDGEMAKNRVGTFSTWSLPAARITSAIARAWPLLAGWPGAVTEFMGERIQTAPTRHVDGNEGLSVRFLKLPRVPGLRQDVADAIARLRLSVQLDGPEQCLFKERTMGIKEVAAALGRGTKETAEIRRQGGLKTIFAIKEKRPVALFDAAEVRSISSFIKERLGFAAASWRIGISYHGVEQLVTMRLLATTEDRYCQVRYGSRQTTETAMDDFRCRLQRASEDIPCTAPITLRKAALAIGGRLKPWGPIFHALLTGGIPFQLNDEDGPLTERIIVDRSAISQLIALEFAASDYPESTFEYSMTRFDAGETLNVGPKAYTPVINAIIGRSAEAKFVRVHDVLQLATTHISAPEIGARLGISSRSAFNLASRIGVTFLGEAGWCRRDAEKLIFADAA
ncbi:hypothetical protein [Sphingosinicella humi]|uniref:TniQ family protein n=1 Tax=Allosphingosinicella humi TaxID=2068657 RepID=A0A2U2J102_9SPHN|nr:hypothetical protein [Sphingosinicella humi]PWG01997.1 hypothetical protein DF286_03285 [Sphingosinicella humi]